MSARRVEHKNDPEEGSRRVHYQKKTPEADSILKRIQRLEHDLQVLKREVNSQYQLEPFPRGKQCLLTCRVGSSQIGFLQDCVLEVVVMPRLTPLPEAPFWVPGLLNLRGSLIPVIDVHSRVTGKPRKYELTDFIIVANVEELSVGFIVQEILDLKWIEGASLEQAPDVPFAAYLIGAVKIDGVPVLVLSALALAHLSELPEPLAT